MVAVFALPIVQTVQLSFSDWRGFGPIDFIGIGNYVDVLTGEDFWNSLRLTVLFAVLATVGIVALRAAARRRDHPRPEGRLGLPGRSGSCPAIVPGTAAAVFWSISVQPNSGVINDILGFLGLGSDHAWLASPQTALYVVIGVAIWISTAFPFLLLAGAIDRVPVEVYEAARIDGAGQWRQFWYFTLPLIRPVLTDGRRAAADLELQRLHARVGDDQGRAGRSPPTSSGAALHGRASRTATSERRPPWAY